MTAFAISFDDALSSLLVRGFQGYQGGVQGLREGRDLYHPGGVERRPLARGYVRDEPGLGLRVLCFGFRVSGLGFRVWGLGFRVSGFEFRVQGSVFRV